MNLLMTSIAVIYFYCMVAAIGIIRKKNEKRNIRLEKIKWGLNCEYARRRLERESFERTHGMAPP